MGRFAFSFAASRFLGFVARAAVASPAARMNVRLDSLSRRVIVEYLRIDLDAPQDIRTA